MEQDLEKKTLDKKLNETLGQFENLSADDKKKKGEDIIEMIKYTNSLTDEIEERRNKFYSDSLILLQVSVAALVLLLSSDSSRFLKFISCIAFIPVIVIQLIVIIVYYRQNESKYVFKDKSLENYSNQWKWFYYGNPYTQKISVGLFSKASASVDHYKNGLKYLAEQYIKETDNSKIKSDLIQLYLLQVHNYYKNRYYLSLVKIRKIGMIVYLAILILCGLIMVCTALVAHLGTIQFSNCAVLKDCFLFK